MNVHFQAVAEAAAGKEGGGRLRLQSVPTSAGGGEFGQASLLHFVYKYPSRSQFVSPTFHAPMDNASDQQVCVGSFSYHRIPAEPYNRISGWLAESAPKP